jgi:hypothetical protein
MDAILPLETSFNFYKTTRFHNPEDKKMGIKIFLLEAVEAHRVVRRRGSHIF